MEFQQRLQQKIAEIDPLVYEKVLQQLLPSSATSSINALDDVHNFNDFPPNNTIVTKNLEQSNAVSNILNVVNCNNNASNTDVVANTNHVNNNDNHQLNNNDVRNEVNLKVMNNHAAINEHEEMTMVEASGQLTTPIVYVSTDIEDNVGVDALSASLLSTTSSSTEPSLLSTEHGPIPAINDSKHSNMDSDSAVVVVVADAAIIADNNDNDTAVEEEDPVKPVAPVQLSNSNDGDQQPLLVHEPNLVCNNIFQTEVVPPVAGDQQHDQLTADAVMVKHTPNQSPEVPLLA